MTRGVIPVHTRMSVSASSPNSALAIASLRGPLLRASPVFPGRMHRALFSIYQEFIGDENPQAVTRRPAFGSLRVQMKLARRGGTSLSLAWRRCVARVVQEHGMTRR